MNKEIPVINRVIHKRELEKKNDVLLSRLMNMKFSNLSSLKNKTETKSAHKVKTYDDTKLIPIEPKNKRVKTVLNDDRIKQENRNMYARLVNQKPTLSSKLFAGERHKNIEYLRRIGRYPYKPNNTVLIEGNFAQESPYQQMDRQRSHTLGDLQDESSMNNIRISLNSLQSTKNYHIDNRLQEEQKKDYLILLWSKIIQLQKNWYSIKFLRFKNHYQIEISPYPDYKTTHIIKLTEDIGTGMLTQNDYDYEYISNNFIKFTNQALCLSFQIMMGSQKKKHFYKFQRKSNKQEEENRQGTKSNYQTRKENSNNTQTRKENSNNAYRKTVFAIENQKNELQLLSNTKSRHRESNQNSINQTGLGDMSKQDIIIELSKR